MAAARNKRTRDEGPGGPSRMPKSVVGGASAGGGGALANAQTPYDLGYQSGYQTGATAQPGNRPIPDIRQLSPTTPPLTIQGASGTSFFGGLIQNDEYNPELHWRDWVTKVEMMVRSDAQIRALLGLVTDTLLAATWSVEPASDDPLDVEVASFVQTALMEDMRYRTAAGVEVQVPWSETLRHILMMLAYGFSPLEVCYRLEDGWVKWARWLPLLPRTVYRWWVGEDNELDGIQTWAYKDYNYRFTNIPASKLLLFSWQKEGQNYEGLSLLRPCFPYWWYKQNYLKIQAIGIERNAIEPPVFYLWPNATQADAQAMLTQATNIRANESMGVIVPSGGKMEYARTSSRGTAGEGILDAIHYCDIMMARAFYAQWLNLGSTETGAYSLDASQKLTWLGALQAVATYIGDVVTHDAIRKLCDYNFPAGSLTAYPKLTCGKLIAQDLQTLTSAIQSLQAFIPPSQEMADYVADLIGLPKAPAGAVQATNPTGGVGGAQGEDDGQDTTGGVGKQGDQQPAADEGDDNGGDGGDGGGGGGEMAELRATAELLSDVVGAVFGADAVEKGAAHLLSVGAGFGHGYNPNRVPAGGPTGGQFAPGPHTYQRQGEHEAGGHRGSPAGEHLVAQHSHAGGSGGGGGGGSHAAKAEHEQGQGRMASRSRKEEPHREPSSKAATGAKAAKEAAGSPKEREELIPRKHGLMGRQAFMTGTSLDAHFVRALYGDHQLAAALGRTSHSDLKLTAEREGIKPGRNKEETIARIVAHVTKVPMEESERVANARTLGNWNVKANIPHEATPKASATHATAASSHEATPKAAKASASKGAGAKASGAKAPAETIHETAARLQREGGLAAEVKPGEGLVPIAKAGEVHFDRADINDAASLSNLTRLYGEHQLGAALHGYSAQSLREFAQSVGVKPSSSKAETVSRITAKVTEGRYSANFPKEASAPKAERATRAPKAAAAKAEGAPKTSRAQAAADRASAAKALVPQAIIPTHEINIAAPIDPGKLRVVYGDHQLRQALSVYSGAKLKEIAETAGVTASRNKATTIERIYQAVTKEPYAAALKRYGGRRVTEGE